jgi:hypothetical protein
LIVPLSVSVAAMLAVQGNALAQSLPVELAGQLAEATMGRPDAASAPADPAEWTAETNAGSASGEAQAAEAGNETEGEEKLVVSDEKPANASATASLLNLLVKQGVIKQEEADGILPQVDDETFVMRQAVSDATKKADEAAKAASQAASAASPPGSRRISYVPEIVKKQLREDIRKEVMTQAKDEGWASPGKYPEWASRIRFYGDLRGRFEGQFYPSGGYNSDQGDYIDFNAINTGSPYDMNDATNPFNGPTFNTTEDRNRFRIRARLGLDADLSDGFTAGMRMATGSDSSPVSTNQTLGGSGGNFSKYSLWLDRAFLKYEADLSATPFDHYGLLTNTNVALTAGRFDRPFWSPTDLMWDSDLGFDGLALQAKRQVHQGFTAFAAAGAFPIFNTALDFSSDQERKFESTDKYLLGAQIGFNWQVRPALGFTFGASYFDFENVQGKLSSPCSLWEHTKSCDTDATRPSFAQKGNSYRPLREIMPPPGWDGTSPFSDSQYFGLVSEYRPLVASARLDFGNFHPVHILIDGEFVWNTALDRDSLELYSMFNREGTATGYDGRYNGGGLGWMTKLTVGHQQFTQFGDWSAHAGYKYLESDATVDAFVDSDFGLGGTNLQGYFIGGDFALTKSVFASAKWLSASGIAGAPYAVDVLQLDINAKF